jgi:hypothetical protein
MDDKASFGYFAKKTEGTLMSDYKALRKKLTELYGEKTANEILERETRGL